LVLWLLLGGNAMAHKVNLFAYVEAGTVYTESYFPDGRMVENGKISVYDSADKLLLEGKTDNEGLFGFPVPKVDDLTIVLDASMGHKASFKLKKADVEAGK
jgi:nickel transport protein